MKKLLLVSVLNIIGFMPLFSQVIINFIPTKEFSLTTDDLINFNLISPVSERTVNIIISAKSKENNEQIFSATLLGFKINSQVKNINYNTNGLNIQYSNSSKVYNNSKLLKAGYYLVCVSVKEQNQLEELTNECEVYQNFPLNPPMLILPENNGVVNTLYPILNWIPPTPVSNFQNIYYTLKLVQINSGQNQFEAMASNAELFLTKVKSTSNIVYPLNAMPLAWDNHYAWQVEAFEDDKPIGKTEIWRFVIKRDSLEELKEKYRMLSFLKLSDAGTDGKIYDSNEDLKIDIGDLKLDSAKIEVLDANNKFILSMESSDFLDIGGGRYVTNLKNFNKIKSNLVYQIQITSITEKKICYFRYEESK